jgi:hypothetical protein
MVANEIALGSYGERVSTACGSGRVGVTQISSLSQTVL